HETRYRSTSFRRFCFLPRPSSHHRRRSCLRPKDIRFDVKQDVAHHPTPQPESNKALIYVVEDLGQYPDCDGGSRAFSTSVGPSSYEGGLGWRMGWRQPREFVLFLRDHFWRASSLRDWQSRLATRSRAFA